MQNNEPDNLGRLFFEHQEDIETMLNTIPSEVCLVEVARNEVPVITADYMRRNYEKVR
jgi:hypothetical protein